MESGEQIREGGRTGDGTAIFRLRFFDMVLISFSITYFFYGLFFLAAPAIWAQNPILPFSEYTPWVRYYVSQHDGWEVYALYVLMFLNIGGVITVCRVVHNRTDRYARAGVRVLAFSLAGCFLWSIGLHPPTGAPGHLVPPFLFHLAFVIGGISLFLWGGCRLQARSPRLLPWLCALILLPVCFVSVDHLLLFDLSFIFAPALRILNGAPLSQVYLQYDLFLSLLAALWLKLGLGIRYFQVLGQASFFLWFLAVFLFARRVFMEKRIAIFLLASLILVRIYAVEGDPAQSFQTTPLRLDLWLPLLIIVNRKGFSHWAAGAYCGVLLIFHNAFGVIYSLAYFEFVAAAAILAYLQTPCEDPAVSRIIREFKTIACRCSVNFLLIAAGWFLHALLFRNTLSAAKLYIRNGVGFMRITPESFYWYIPVVVSVLLTIAVVQRARLEQRYLHTTLFSVCLAIGNLIYFFGRSHEHNLLNISIILLFLLFLFADLAGSYLRAGASARSGRITVGVLCASASFLLLVIVLYGEKITDKTNLQRDSILQGRLLYPLQKDPVGIMADIACLKDVTGEKKEVFFASNYDFLYDYYGGYKPVGYFNPFPSWLIKQDMVTFLADLVNRGYFVVIQKDLLITAMTQQIPYSRRVQRCGFVILWNEERMKAVKTAAVF